MARRRPIARGAAGSSASRRALLVIFVAAVFVCVAAVALAEEGRRGPVDFEAELHLGARAEEEGAFARALEHYRACIAGGAPARLARNARNRILWIEEHAEGDFVPLATLARVRRDPSALDDPARLAKLAADTESFPAGRVRSELRLRVAEARLRRGGPDDEALAGLRAVVEDPSSGGSDRLLAERDLVMALLAAGRLEAARHEVEAHPYDPRSTAEVARRVRRRSLMRAGAGAVVLLGLALSVAYRRRRHARLGVPLLAASPQSPA
jgi:hypothetical protein